ncbi:MAG: leucine-rich repeat domain-containing protein, partial [Bacteroidales bacterium]|nr:leucine-rich repeat domain-containing protein [Bacteroidales bacterium]
AFKKCSGLTSITIPASVISIGEHSFCESGLTSVTFAEGSQLTSIYGGAFQKCSGLQQITIPASVTSIGISAFEKCSGLTSVTILASSLEVYGPDAFEDNPAGRKIYVPEESVDTYKDGWLDCADDILPISAKPTSIGNATMPSGNAQAADEAWYSLDGRKLSSKPTERGVYLHQGRKVVVK